MRASRIPTADGLDGSILAVYREGRQLNNTVQVADSPTPGFLLRQENPRLALQEGCVGCVFESGVQVQVFE